MGLMDQLGLPKGDGSADAEYTSADMPKSPEGEGKSDHYKGIAGRLKGAIDSGNDARVKQILRDCIEEVLGEE